MAEPTQYLFDYKELAEMLVKHQNIHKGLWAVYFKFGIQAANMSHSATENYVPTAMVPILEVGIQKTEKETNLSVDASKVNPAPRPKKSK